MSCRALCILLDRKKQGALGEDDRWQKWKSLMTEISGSHSFFTSLLASNFQDVYHPLGMCSRLLMAKSEMTALFILVSQRRPSGSFALMISITRTTHSKCPRSHHNNDDSLSKINFRTKARLSANISRKVLESQIEWIRRELCQIGSLSLAL